MTEHLPQLIFLAGIGQLGVLVASSLVPIRLDWKNIFATLPKLHRQMYWVYGGYVVLSIIGFGLISLFNADELAGGSRLARSLCGFISVFWSIRICLQPVFDVKEFLTTWWLTAGYHLLTVLFLYFIVVFAWAALHPVA